jgi:hypothetical protein
LVYFPLLFLGVGRHQVIQAMKLRNISNSLVIRIRSADPNSFMARVSALSRYDPNKHGCTMYFFASLCINLDVEEQCNNKPQEK